MASRHRCDNRPHLGDRRQDHSRFTRNWLVKRSVTALPAAHGMIDRAALAALHTGLLGWALFPASKLAGAILIAAAALNLWRLARWRGFATGPEPLLAILHLGYAWVVLGTALLGVSMLSSAIPQAAAIHAFTAGGVGTMVLAVMTRVARGHTGRALEADRFTIAIYLMITVAAVIRVDCGICRRVRDDLHRRLGGPVGGGFWSVRRLLCIDAAVAPARREPALIAHPPRPLAQPNMKRPSLLIGSARSGGLRDELDLATQIIYASDQAQDHLLAVTVREVAGAEVLVRDAVFEDVEGGGEHGRGDREDGFFGTAPCA